MIKINNNTYIGGSIPYTVKSVIFVKIYNYRLLLLSSVSDKSLHAIPYTDGDHSTYI